MKVQLSTPVGEQEHYSGSLSASEKPSKRNGIIMAHGAGVHGQGVARSGRA
jgi:hypothetical protein